MGGGRKFELGVRWCSVMALGALVGCGAAEKHRKPLAVDAGTDGTSSGGGVGAGGSNGSGGALASGGSPSAGGTGGTAGGAGGTDAGTAGAPADSGLADASTDGASAPADASGGPDASAPPPDASDAAPLGSDAGPLVYAYYASNGRYWNDYVVADGATRFDASDTPCNKATDGPTYDACIHAGEMRRFLVANESDCTGVTAADSLGAFDWTCRDLGSAIEVVSTGLKTGKNLSDLLDFTVPAFRLESVTVQKASVTVYTSPPALWWNNPVIHDPDGFPIGVAKPHDVIVTRAGDAGYYRMYADQVAFVVEPGAKLMGASAGTSILEAQGSFQWVEGTFDATGVGGGIVKGNTAFDVLRNVEVDGANGSGININTTRASRYTGLTGVGNGVTANGSYNVTIVGAKYLDVSGIHSSAAVRTGIAVNQTTYSRFQDITSTGDGTTAGNSIQMTANDHNTFTNLTDSSPKGTGIVINGATNDTFNDVTVTNTPSPGVAFTVLNGTYDHVNGLLVANSGFESVRISGRYHTFEHVRVLNGKYTGDTGIYFGADSSLLYDAVVAGNLGTGVSISTNNDNVFVGVTSTAAVTGVLIGGGYHVLLGITAANNETSGIAPTGYGYYENLLTANNGTVGIDLYNSLNTILDNVVSGSNGTVGVKGGNQKTTFTGVFKSTGNTTDCSGIGGVTGLDSSCTMTGTSTAISSAGSITSSFVGKVAADAANASDTGGTATYGSITDFTSFDVFGRGWGRDGAGAFPDPGQRGACRGNDTCRIWDFSLLATDTSARGVAPLPTGSMAVTHVWSPGTLTMQSDCDTHRPGSTFVAGTPNTCQNTFLRYAVEVLDDSIGNDNGLCESSETCIVSPNAGAYQGHGNLVSAGTFSDGTITGVTLLKYESNGY